MPNGIDDTTDAGAPNPENYTDNGDGTVTDNVTHLMWQQDVPPMSYDWAGAKTYCATTLSGLGGHDDWRLPSLIELVSIVDYSNFGSGQPAIKSAVFPATPLADFWSSTPLAGSPSNAWLVAFGLGYTYSVDVTNTFRVRCVR